MAFFDHDDGDRVFVLGGNQNDAVNVAGFPKSRVLSYRLPTETAPLPTDTTLPNILAIDPSNAPPHLLGTGAAISNATVTREARASGKNSRERRYRTTRERPAAGPFHARISARRDRRRVRPRTASAVSTFQSTNGLRLPGSPTPIPSGSWDWLYPSRLPRSSRPHCHCPACHCPACHCPASLQQEERTCSRRTF